MADTTIPFVAEPDLNTHLTKAAAAELCKVSASIVQRDKRDGRLPNCVEGPNHALYVSYADLIAIGRLSPAQVPTATQVLATARAAEDITDLRRDLAVAEARLAELDARILLLTEHNAFLTEHVGALRALVETAVK